MNKKFIKQITLFLMAICLIAGCAFLNRVKAHASEPSTKETSVEAVSVTEINYDNLTMTVNMNENSILYYSKDDKTWYEMEGSDMTATNAKDASTKIMDISWITATKETSIYLKGDRNKKSVQVTIPKQNTALKVKFDKADGTLNFDGEETTIFQWRKSTDYTWNTVPMGESAKVPGDIKITMDWKTFIDSLEPLRIKGAKIVVRTPGINGKIDDKGNLDVGARPSKEVTVSITKRGNAPSTSINVKKLTLNTTTKQEYSTDDGKTWKDCSKNMRLSEILSDLTKAGTIKIRTQATATAGYSKTLTLVVEAQEAAPTISEGYTEDNAKVKNPKYVIQFSDASKATPYEYMIVKDGVKFDDTKTWKTVTKNTPIKLSQTSAPDGSTIYYRKKGFAANKSKGTSAVLPSAWNTMKVKIDSGTTTPAAGTGTTTK